MKKMPFGIWMLLILPFCILGVCALQIFVTGRGCAGDPEWENYTETYLSIAEAEAALGEEMGLGRLLDPTDAPYDGWRQYIEKEYGADMLAKLEKERTTLTPYEEVILYHEIGGGAEQPDSWEQLEARIRYDGRAHGSGKDEIHYPHISFLLYFKDTNINAAYDKAKCSYIHNNGEEVAYQEYTDNRGYYGFTARFEWNGYPAILSTESPTDSWFGMKTLKRLLQWDMIYIPAGV